MKVKNMLQLKFKKKFQFIKNEKNIIKYYFLFKILSFFILSGFIFYIKSSFHFENKLVYDLKILQSINIDLVFSIIIFIFASAILIILESNLLSFYFTNKIQNRKITKEIFVKEFILTSWKQLKILLIQIIEVISFPILFILIAFGLFYLLGQGIVFYIFTGILLILLFYKILNNLLRYLLINISFYYNPNKKNFFYYLAQETNEKKKKKTIKTTSKNLIELVIIYGLTLVLYLIFREFSEIFSERMQVYVDIILIFILTIVSFLSFTYFYVKEFYDLVEIYFDKKFTRTKEEKIYFPKILVAFFAVIVVGAYVYVANVSIGILKQENNKKIIFAHRGFSEYNVQNSMNAFSSAVGESDFIELDVQISKDDKILIFHDENFEKLTSQIGVARQRSWDEIKTYTVSERRDSFGGVKKAKIVLLEDVLKNFSDKINFAIEIKNTDKTKTKLITKKVVDLMEKYQIDKTSFIISLDYDVLKEVKKLNKNIKRGLILTLAINSLDDFDVDFYFANNLFKSEKLIEQAHNLGRKIYFWGFNFLPTDFEKEFMLNADGFIVDNPRKAKQQIKSYKKISIFDKLKIILSYGL